MKKSLIVGVASSLLGALLWSGAAKAADSVIQDVWHTWNQAFLKSSAVTSTTTVAGLGYSFAIKNVGTSDITYQVSQATRTYRTGAASVIVTDPSLVPANSTLKVYFEAPVSSPSIIISGVGVGTTYYIWLNHGQKLN